MMSVNSLPYYLSGLAALLLPLVKRIAFALAVYLIGRWGIRKLLRALEDSKGMTRLEGTLRTFTLSFTRIGLYVLLAVAVISILGVETTSIAAVLASTGVAVGLALQGALSNLAGGMMLVLFKPFQQGDYVDAAGASGTVKEVSLFYTVLITPDNKRITIPNGALMNANVVDYSSEERRRVDLTFTCARTENPGRVRELMLKALAENEKVLDAPDPPFARLSGGTAESMEFTVRAWCRNEDYWEVFYDLTERITEAMLAAGVRAPEYRVVS